MFFEFFSILLLKIHLIFLKFLSVKIEMYIAKRLPGEHPVKNRLQRLVLQNPIVQIDVVLIDERGWKGVVDGKIRVLFQ